MALPNLIVVASVLVQRLVTEVLGKDSAEDKVPMEKIVMLIWQFRDDKNVAKFMTRFVAKVSTASKGAFESVSHAQLFNVMLSLLV